MSWFETLTKETFQTIVREAVKEDLEILKQDVSELKRQNHLIAQAIETLKTEIEGVKQRLTKLEEHVSRLEDQIIRVRESQMNFADRVGRLEGTLEGSLRGIAADLKLDLYENSAARFRKRPQALKLSREKKAKKHSHNLKLHIFSIHRGLNVLAENKLHLRARNPVDLRLHETESVADRPLDRPLARLLI